MQLLLGNSDAIEPQVGTAVTSPEGEDTNAPEPKKISGDQILTIDMPDGRPLDEALTEIKVIWGLHSTGKPQWVEGNNDLLVAAVANTFGCPVGRDEEDDDNAS
jgi:hypothetical protein